MKYEVSIPIWSVVDQANAKVHYMARAASESAQNEATLSELSEGENEDMILSSIDKALSALSSIIALDASNTYQRPEDLEGSQDPQAKFTLLLPSNFDKGAGKALAEAMAHYCINVIVQDWVAVVLPTHTDAYVQEQAKSVLAIRDLLKKRVRPQYEDDTPVYDTIEVVYND